MQKVKVSLIFSPTFFIFAATLLIVAAGLLYLNEMFFIESYWRDYQIERITINNEKYRVAVADTVEKQTKGLMYLKEKPDEIDGMIFKFDGLQKRYFWNQNTYLPLRIYWLRNGQVAGETELPSIIESEKPVTVESPEEIDTVVEIIQQVDR